MSTLAGYGFHAWMNVATHDLVQAVEHVGQRALGREDDAVAKARVIRMVR